MSRFVAHLWFTRLRRLLTALLAAVAFTTAGVSRADDIPIEHMREVLLTIEVRKALLSDPQLAPLNIGVSVAGRAALLWGPVPSMAVKQHAEAVLRKFPYISEVRNGLHIRTEEIEFSAPMKAPKENSLKAEPRQPHREPPASGTATSLAIREDKNEVHTQKPKSEAAAKPVEHKTLSPQSDRPPAARPTIDLESPAALEKKLGELRITNSRYDSIHVRVLSRDVLLTADANSAAALYEMAQTVARMPGVARVIVREQ